MSILEKLNEGLNTSTPAETAACGEAVAEILPGDCTLALFGELGSGKTTFVKGLAKFWQIAEDITSPTYNLFVTYTGIRNLIHLDAYRIEDEKQWDDLMIEDFLAPPFCLAIEWPENLGSRVPEDSWTLTFTIVQSGVHLIRLNDSDSR